MLEQNEQDPEWHTFCLATISVGETYTIEWNQPFLQNQHGGYYIEWGSNTVPRTAGPTWWWYNGAGRWTHDNDLIVDGVNESYMIFNVVTVTILSETYCRMTTNAEGVIKEYVYTNIRPSTVPTKFRLMYHFNPNTMSPHAISVAQEPNEVWGRLSTACADLNAIETFEQSIKDLSNDGYAYHGGSSNQKWLQKACECFNQIDLLYGLKSERTPVMLRLAHIRHARRIYHAAKKTKIEMLCLAQKTLSEYKDIFASLEPITDQIHQIECDAKQVDERASKYVDDLLMYAELIAHAAKSTYHVDESNRSVYENVSALPSSFFKH
jgi:hypothetical protein